MLYLNHAFSSKKNIFFLWGLVVFSPPALPHLLAGHCPAPLAPAGVCITEKHNSVGPVLYLAERFCIVLVTTKIKIIFSQGIHKKKIGEGGLRVVT